MTQGVDLRCVTSLADKRIVVRDASVVVKPHDFADGLAEILRAGRLRVDPERAADGYV